MGIGSSSPSFGDKGGIIEVGDKNVKLINTMNKLFQQLLRSTNPINFKQALESTGNKTCSGILVLLAPTIEQDFQKLAFENPETKQIVLSVFKGYESMEDFSSTILTKTMCKEITLFFLRLILLVGTCVISVRPNKGLTGLLGTIGTSFVEPSKAYEGIAKIGMQPISSGAIEDLKRASPGTDEARIPKTKAFQPLYDDGKDTQLKVLIASILINDRSSIVKKRAADDYFVVVYDGNEYVIDLKHLFVYRNERDLAKKVGVLSLSTLKVDPPKKETSSGRDGGRDSGRDGGREGGRDGGRDAGRGRPPFIPRVGGTRKNRTSRGDRYTRRQQRGGDIDLDAHIVKLRSSGTASELFYYIYNRTDESCNKTDPTRTACPLVEKYSITTQMSTEDFVNQIIPKYKELFNDNEYSRIMVNTHGAILEPISGTGIKVLGYKNLTVEDRGTYAKLENLLESGEVGKLEEGTCLAVYRAYLLASGIVNTDKGNQLKTYICHDKWEKTRVSDVPLFALLDQLYRDRLGKQMEESTKNKYELFLDQLVSKGTMKYTEDTSAKGKTFENLEFKALSKDAELCRGGKTGLDTVTDTGIVGNTIQYYNAIALDLVNLIEKVTKIIDEIIDFSLFIKEERIKLRPIFVTDSRGAQVVLTEFIEKTRMILEEHILKVEDAYYQGFSIIANTTIKSTIVDIAKDEDALAKSIVA